MRSKASALITLLVALALWSCSDSSGPVDEPLRNQVAIDTGLVVAAGVRFPVRVSMENSQAVRAVAVPLTYDVESVSCDSISFVNSRLVDWDIDISSVDDESRLVEIWRLTTQQPLAPGSGTLATLYFRAHGDSPTVDMIIDTTWINYNTQLHFTGLVVGDTLVIPEFTPGTVHVDSVQ